MMDNSTSYWRPYDRAAAVISFTLFSSIVFLNGIVIYVLRFRNVKRTRLHFFILHLAIAEMIMRFPSQQSQDNFLIGTFNCLGDGVESTLHGVWYGGDAVCKIWRYMKVVLILASNNLLIGVSVDRYLAVKYPMKFVKIGNKLDKCLVFGAWMLGFTLPIFVIPFTEIVPGKICDFNFPAGLWKPYILTISMAVYVLPSLLVTACYIGICVVIWRKWKHGLQLSEINDHHKSHESLNGRPARTNGLLPKAKVKSIKMTLAVCIAFFICWTPYFVFSILNAFKIHGIERRLYMVIGMLYPLNSACNPLIFMAFNIRMFLPKRGSGQGAVHLLKEGVTVTHDMRLSQQCLNLKHT